MNTVAQSAAKTTLNFAAGLATLLKILDFQGVSAKNDI